MLDSNKIKSTFGANLKELRIRHNLTQEKLAEFINVQPATITGIETGRSFTSSEVLAEICKYFNVEPSLLFYKRLPLISEKAEDSINEIKRMLSSFDSEKLKEINNILIALQR